MTTHRMGRKALPYPGSVDELCMLVDIDGYSVRYDGPYRSKPTRDKSGHMLIKLPVSVHNVERKQRKTQYFRVDHIVWALATGEWPEGWIEHLNGMRVDCSIDNLVHCDPDGRRWWRLNGELVEVQGDDTPITYVVTDGNRSIIVPKLVGVDYEDDDEPYTSTIAPRPEGVPAMPEVPDPG